MFIRLVGWIALLARSPESRDAEPPVLRRQHRRPCLGRGRATATDGAGSGELGPGTLYGALDRLERLGLIESLPASERRHPYRITAPGAAALRVHLDSLERVSAAGRLRLQPGGA